MRLLFYLKHNEKYVSWYILGLIDYGIPMSNLSQRQLDELWEIIITSFRNKFLEEDFFLKGKISELQMPQMEESFKLAKVEEYDSYMTIFEPPLIGFYDRRIIMRFICDIEEFFTIKKYRDDILRDLKFLFEDLKGASLTADDTSDIGEKDWIINGIYIYPLIIVKNCIELIQEEWAVAKENKIDPIFSIPTTSLTYSVSERGDWFNFFSFKEHYIRLSVRSAIVYCDGTIPSDLKQTLINAIYLGGLYEQMKRLQNGSLPLTRQRMRAIDDDVLLQLASVIRSMIQNYLSSAHIAEKQRFVNFFIAALSFLLSIIAIIVTVIQTV
jgi:hypothetical protein